MRLQPVAVKVALGALAVVCLVMTWFSVRWHFANAVAPNFDRRLPQSPMIADWLIEVAPSDPLVRQAAASTYERTFDADDLARALAEYEAAAAASPHNYLNWLNLGRVRSQSGDVAGAEAAFVRAEQLAPNYAAVQWAYGNFLLRSGRSDEGFALMARAAQANTDYARSAALTALQLFDGDSAQAVAVMGDSDASRAAMQTALIEMDRPEDAAAVWLTIGEGARKARYREAGTKLASDLMTKKHFALAASVLASLGEGTGGARGQMGNGGFEDGVKLREAGPFEWQIADGASPRIGLSEERPHSGRYSLAVIFNSFDTAAFRSISQVVVVEPGRQYEIEGFYRSDVKTASNLRWEVAEAPAGSVLARSEPLQPTAEWTRFTLRFTVPAGVDGVMFRFTRDGCTGASCPTTGTIAFDSLSLRAL